MKKMVITNRTDLEKYFELDADKLEQVQNGEITGITIEFDEENKTARYCLTADEQKYNNANIFYDDDYEGVKEFLEIID